jgi:branched-chain amino acid transport system substrate-binding protein
MKTMRGVAAGMLAAAVAACGGEGSGEGSGEVLVGVEIPLTGAMARAGTGAAEGIAVAAEVYNAKNPAVKVKLVRIDDESQPAKAVAAVEQLASQGVAAIVGGYGTNNIGPASEAADKAGLVYITSGGVDASLTQRGLKHFFRINNAAGYTRALVGLFADQGVQSVSILHSTKEATAGLAKEVHEALAARGVRTVVHAFDPAITDFKPIVNKVKVQDKTEAVAMIGYENDYVGILRAARVLKPALKSIAGVWSLATPKMAADFPELMPNVYGTAFLPFPTEFATEEGKVFAATYQRLFSKEPDYVGQFGYVQGLALFEAIERAHKAGTLKQPGGLAAELRRTDRETLIGRLQFDEGGDNPNFVQRMGQHQDGKIVIVWPKDAASGPMRFPAVPW